MPVANLMNVPKTETDLLVWSFHHADHHLQIIDAVAAQKGSVLVQYVLDPIAPFDLANWLRRHQTAHNAFNAALSANGQDLTTVDFSKPDQLQSWIDIHAAEHLFAGTTLGVD